MRALFAAVTGALAVAVLSSGCTPQTSPPPDPGGDQVLLAPTAGWMLTLPPVDAGRARLGAGWTFTVEGRGETDLKVRESGLAGEDLERALNRRVEVSVE